MTLQGIDMEEFVVRGPYGNKITGQVRIDRTVSFLENPKKLLQQTMTHDEIHN